MHLELSRAGTTVPYLYPQEVRRYHPCTLRRYDGTTLVPGGGTLVKFLFFGGARTWAIAI